MLEEWFLQKTAAKIAPWCKEQMEDLCICLFSKKEAGVERSSWQEVAASDVSIKVY